MSVLLAIVAANESAMLLFLYIPFVIWLIIRKSSVATVLLVLLAAMTIFVTTLIQLNKTPTLSENTILKWSATNSINGSILRGFMLTEAGNKIYSTYRFQDEKEKEYFEKRVLTGQYFAVKGELVEPRAANHAYGFSMMNYFKGHQATGIYEIKELRYVGRERNLQSIMANQRAKMQQQIDTFFPASIRAEAKALLIGDQSDVEPQHSRMYQKFGISHLFAISGLHVGIVSMLLREVLLKLRVRVEYATIIVALGLPLYALLVGGAPSVWRAVTMVLFVLLSTQFGQKLSSEGAIAASIILFAFVSPNAIYQIGFQLSYAAAAAIIFSSKIIASYQNSIAKAFIITTVCQLLVAPLLLYHFFEFSISSFLMNLLFVPLFSIVILPANLFLLAASFLAKPVFNLAIWLYEPLRIRLFDFMDMLQQLPIHLWTTGRPSILTSLALFLVVVLLLLSWELRKRWYIYIALLAIPIAFFTLAPKMSSQMMVTFLSVGQGDSTIIEMPNRSAVYVIDVGGILRFDSPSWQQPRRDFEVGRQIVVPYLKGRGITTIDKLILTHADADHVEGAEEVLQEITVKEIHVPPNAASEKVMTDLLKEAQKQRIPIKEKIAGDSWLEGEVSFQYLMPYNLEYEGNNSSLVTMFGYKGFKILIPGDLERQGELELIAKNPTALEGTTVLKAGHHGSKTSTNEEFLQVVDPQYVIYSTGLNNRYRHPAIEVVERVEQAGIPSVNTAEAGTIQLEIGESFQWKQSK